MIHALGSVLDNLLGTLWRSACTACTISSWNRGSAEDFRQRGSWGLRQCEIRTRVWRVPAGDAGGRVNNTAVNFWCRREFACVVGSFGMGVNTGWWLRWIEGGTVSVFRAGRVCVMGSVSGGECVDSRAGGRVSIIRGDGGDGGAHTNKTNSERDRN